MLKVRLNSINPWGFGARLSPKKVFQSFPKRNFLAPAVLRLTQEEFVDAKGCWLTNTKGRKFLDFTSGIGVASTGHCHPHVVEKVREQVGKYVHVQQNVGLHPQSLELADRLQCIMPEGIDTFLFQSSGSEAIEGALKLARVFTKRPNFIVFQGGFHGRTMGALSCTSSKLFYRGGIGPLLSGVFTIPFPYCSRCPSSANSVTSCCNEPLKQLEILFKQQCCPSETAAILIEPILGEGGYVSPPLDFLQNLRQVCDKYEILLIADEVQSGMGRTGKYFAVEHFKTIPDILVFAKGVASGYPLSGVAAPYSIMAKSPPGSMGGTYGGNAVCCAAANATLDVFQQEDLLENAVMRGDQLLQGLLRLKNKFPSLIRDVRGHGLMIGCEFNAPNSFAQKLSKQCAENGLLLMTASVYETVRFIPPLIVSPEEIFLGLEIFETSLEQLLNVELNLSEELKRSKIEI